MNSILQAALDFLDAGISVVPASADGSKAPIGSWKQYQVNQPSREQVIDWFSGNAQGLGVICGQVSGNLEMLELEGRAVANGVLDQAKELAYNSGLKDIWELISFGYVEATPSGGIHWLYRIADEIVPGNTKLARRPGANDTIEVLAETRGEGGFVVTAPSHGSTHPSGRAWQMLTGSAVTIPTITMEERNAIHSVFRAFDEMPAKIAPSIMPSKESTGDKPGDDFNARASWKEILEPKGWKIIFTSNGVTYWRRPGKDSGVSATTGRNDGDNLFVFSTSTTFESEKPYSKFAAYAHLEHSGDFSQAAKALKAQGFGAPSVTALPSINQLQKPKLTLVPSDEQVEGSHIEQVRPRSSWYPKPLDLDGTEQEPAPEFLSRDDGHRLFYRGKINALLGESESGKTWVALHAVAQSLHIAQQVTYIDFEDSARGILSRLRSLGMQDRHFAKFTYASPDENLTLDQRMDLVDALMEQKPEFIIVDGVNAAMTLLNLDLTSNRDATFFSQQLLKPLAQSGAAVITIDHVTKSKDSRGNYAIGAQAKRADINGAAIMAEVAMPFGRGMTGEISLKVTKDRPGHVRAISKEAKYVGRVIIASSANGDVKMTIQAPLESAEAFRPTHLMEQVSRLVEASSAPLSKNVVENEIKGKRDYIRQAIQTLINEGYLKVSNGSRNSIVFESIRPYREFGEEKPNIPSFQSFYEVEREDD